ncbi:MAG: SGNH/GDSL hydrolase family protein [Thermodesulfobacteriota bacterium]
MGFRGPEPERFPDRPILFLGDSFTECYCVDDGEEFPELVRNSLEKRFGKKRITVVNAAIENTGNAHWVKFLEKEGKRFNPRLVVLQFMDNDFSDNVREHFFTLSPSGNLVELPVPPPSFARRIQKVIELIPFISYSYVIGFANQRFYSLATFLNTARMRENISTDIENDFKERLTFRLWEEVLKICNQNNWPVFAVMVNINGKRLTGLEAILKQYNVEAIKVPEKNERRDLYYRADWHWNSFGHAFVADLIVQHLTASKQSYLFK